ncbi:MAG: metallophosphoesterase [Planctomycetia bacterium]|nr:metallophosphoesterase [Planctomycetia bacterium]
MKLLHISDLHFGPPYREKVGQAVLRLAPALAPDVVVASGDFTQRAKDSQFADARAFLDKLPALPTVVVPGNHDVPLYRFRERMLDPHGLYRKHISSELNRVWNVDGAVFVGLDSTAPHTAISNGRISEEQLKFCADSFANTGAGLAKIVVAHHHFAPAPDKERDRVMPKAKRAMKRFVEMGVDMVLGGHLHRAYIGDSLDIYPDLRSGHQGIIIVQCGTTTSRRGRAREKQRNTLNTIQICPELVEVTHYMYFDDTDGFEPISRHVFPRRGIRSVERNNGAGA